MSQPQGCDAPASNASIPTGASETTPLVKPPVVAPLQKPQAWLGITSQAALVRLVTCIISLAEGYDGAVFGAVATRLVDEFRLSAWDLGMLAALGPMATFIGAPLAGLTMNLIGRKTLLLLACLVIAGGSLIQALAAGVLGLGLGRFVLGVGTGAGLATVTVYMAEVSPAAVRGTLTSMEEIFINVGMSLAFGVSWLVIGVPGFGWRAAMMFGVMLPLFAASIMPWPWTPESPRYYLMCGKVDEARRTMRDLGISHDEAEQTIDAWNRRSIEGSPRDGSSLQRLRAHHRPLVLAIGVVVASMLTGISPVHYFMPWVLSQRLSEEDALKWSTIIGTLKFLILFPVCFFMLDHIGRRPLLCSSAFAFACATGLTAVAFMFGLPGEAIAIGIGCSLCTFSFGIGPATWTYLAEVLPTSIRGDGTGLALMFGRIVSCLWMLCFPILFSWKPEIPFGICAVLTSLAFTFYLTMCPETTRKTLENIQQSFAGHK